MQLAVVYPVEQPVPNPRKAAILASLFDVVILSVDAQSINPERGIWGIRWHPTPGDAILTDTSAALRRAGLTRQIYKWSSIPAHGTIEGKITFQSYTRGAGPWVCDENGDALIPGRSVFDPTLDFVKNPANIDPVWVKHYVEHAIKRYGPTFEGWIDFNEPGDGNYYPPIATLDYDEAYERLWRQVYLPAARVRELATLGGMPTPGCGPEAAYDDDLRRLLVKHQDYYVATGQIVWEVKTFHAYPPNDNATADGALNELAIRRPIVLDLTGKADAWMTEIHDAGVGWFHEYFQRAPSVYPELGAIAWLHNDATLFTAESLTPEAIAYDMSFPVETVAPRSYLLSEWGKQLMAMRTDMRRRAVQ